MPQSTAPECASRPISCETWIDGCVFAFFLAIRNERERNMRSIIRIQARHSRYLHHEKSLFTDVFPSWFFFRTCESYALDKFARNVICNTDLRNRELKVFLGDVLPALPQRIHPSLGTDTTHLGTRALSHLLCQSTQIDSAL